MSDRRNEFPADTTIALVTFTDAALLRQYAANQAVSYLLLRDPDRGAYRALGLDRASMARVWGLRSARKYLEIFRTDGFRRPKLARSAEDTRQLGGNFVIDPTGRLHWGFWGTGPDDRPTIDELLQAAHTAHQSDPHASK